VRSDYAVPPWVALFLTELRLRRRTLAGVLPVIVGFQSALAVLAFPGDVFGALAGAVALALWLTLMPVRDEVRSQRIQHRVAGPLLAALEEAWSAIRRHHPEIPHVRVAITSGLDRRRPELSYLGQFTSAQDLNHHGPGARPEVTIAGEMLDDGAQALFATLLHEAAHALAEVRAVTATSEDRCYHDRRFKLLAEELGLRSSHAPAVGWSAVVLTEATTRRYAAPIAALERAITTVRRRCLRGSSRRVSRFARELGLAP
jgi:hypothetical protein